MRRTPGGRGLVAGCSFLEPADWGGNRPNDELEHTMSKTSRGRITLSQKLEHRFEESKQLFRAQIEEWVKGVNEGTLPPGRYVQQWLTRNWRYVFVCPRCIALSGITSEIGQPFASRNGEMISHPPLCRGCSCSIWLTTRGASEQAEAVPRDLWSAAGLCPVPSAAEIAAAKESKQWETAVELLHSRLDAEERHAATVRRIYGDGPLADPTHYQSLAVVLRKLGDTTEEKQVVERFRSQPHEIGTKKVQALLERAN